MFTNIRDKAIVALYRAQDAEKLAAALFEFFAEIIPGTSSVFVLHAGAAGPDWYCSHDGAEPFASNPGGISEAIEQVLNIGTETAVYDFSLSMKKGTAMAGMGRYFRDYMKRVGAGHGVCLFAGRHSHWQACLTIFRSKNQGGFSSEELKILHKFRPYLQSTIERVIGKDEAELCRRAMESFVWGLPSAVIILNWDLKVLYGNASALELTDCWRSGRAYAHTKKAKSLTLPDDIAAALEQEKGRLAQTETRFKNEQRPRYLARVGHGTEPSLSARLFYYSNHAPLVNGGGFLVSLQRLSEKTDNSVAYEGMLTLSPRERDVVVLAAQGKRSADIARQLGTAAITVRIQLHSAYKKLGIKTRFELMSLFTRERLEGSPWLKDPDGAPRDLSLNAVGRDMENAA